MMRVYDDRVSDITQHTLHTIRLANSSSIESVICLSPSIVLHRPISFDEPPTYLWLCSPPLLLQHTRICEFHVFTLISLVLIFSCFFLLNFEFSLNQLFDAKFNWPIEKPKKRIACEWQLRLFWFELLLSHQTDSLLTSFEKRL